MSDISEKDIVRLRHMLDAARMTQLLIKDETRKSLDDDWKLQLALTRAAEIVGEAAQISREVHNANPQIEWAGIVALRNRIIHGYFNVNYDILWEIVIKDVPTLMIELEKLIPPLDEDER